MKDLASTQQRIAGVAFGALVLAIIFTESAVSRGQLLPTHGFAATAALMVAGLGAIGWALNGRPAGLLIDSRNRVSLSKLQMLAWTVLVIAALATAAAWRLNAGGAVAALKIQVPLELLGAMGIAVGSFVATPALLSRKLNEGKLEIRDANSEAQWADMFRGDELSESDSPDLSKIQQFAITILLLAVYSAAVMQNFVDKDSFAKMPALDPGFLLLMAVSHGSYLAYKAAPHGKSGPSSQQPAASPATSNAVG